MPNLQETWEFLEELRKEYKCININVGLLEDGTYSCNFKTLTGDSIGYASDIDLFTAVHTAYEKFIPEIEKRGGKNPFKTPLISGDLQVTFSGG
jgi:hypothetical protein